MANCWLDVAGVGHSFSGSVISGVGDAVPCVNDLFGISYVLGKETPSISGSKSGTSICTVSLNSCAYDDFGSVSVVLPAYCICLHTNIGIMNMFAEG